MSLRRIFVLAAFAIAAPLATQAQSCSPGYTYSPLPGGGYSCVPVASSAPEVGTSASIGGIAVLMGGVLMLRGRKRTARLDAATPTASATA